jgi:pseudaminic acid synthase
MKFSLPFFIAEISANHQGNFLNAKNLIKAAKKYGADAVKLQTYTPDTMTLNSNKKYFKIKNGLWKGYKLWDLYNDAKTPYEWHKELFLYAKKIGITIFSSPFDEYAVDFLEKLNAPMYKVSSFELTDLMLIKKIALTKKPIIISTGMGTINEIEDAFNVAKKNGAKDITLLYCVSNYPSKVEDFNLNNILILKKKFKCKVGLSDHSLDNRVAIAAIACGADVIEKHIALDKQTEGLDIKFSLKGREIGEFRKDIDVAYKLLGKKFFHRNKSENKNRILRRSIFISNDIKKGEKFTKDNIKRIRPGNGIHPKYYNKLMNKKVPKNLFKGEPLTKKILSLLKIDIKK